MTDLVTALIGLAAAVISVVLPVVLPKVLSYLHVRVSAEQQTMLANAAERAAGLAYKALAEKAAAGTTSLTAEPAALSQGVRYLVASMPETVRDLGVDAAHLENLVKANLGRLLAVDPNVSVAPAPKPALTQAKDTQEENTYATVAPLGASPVTARYPLGSGPTTGL
jgi:hypothetical protein